MTTAATNRIVWDADADIGGTSLVDYFEAPWSFEETIARLITRSGQDPVANAGGCDKVTVEFVGRFDGAVFTLYDYYGDRRVHIGGDRRQLNVIALQRALVEQLRDVTPTPYEATARRVREAREHGWSPTSRCDTCAGSGRANRMMCRDCHGTGVRQ